MTQVRRARRAQYAYGACLVLAASVLAQSSSSESTLTIQTSPPDPFGSSAGNTIVSGSSSFSASPFTINDPGTGSAASATATSSSTPAGFPQQCASQCQVVASALQRCNPSFVFNATCLCTTEIEQGYLNCVECALAQSGSRDTATFQAIINAYIEQCRSAPFSATTLPNVTVTIPASSSALNMSASRTSSSMLSTSMSSSAAPYSSAASSAAASASQTSGAAAMGLDIHLGGLGWMGLWMATALLGGVILVI